MSILFIHADDTKSITELSAIVHGNKTHPYISCGVTIKKLQGGDQRINTAVVGGTRDTIENWVRAILPPVPSSPASRSYVQRPVQQAPIAQQPVYTPANAYTHAPAQKSKNPHIYTRANLQRPSTQAQAQAAGPPPAVGQISMADVFASQLTGTRGDEEGFSARDAKFIAGLMCETATIGANQI